MSERIKRFPPLQTMEKRKPKKEIDVDDEMSPEARIRRRVARVIIEIVRRRLYESRSKFLLRKQLRAERMKNRRLLRKRERELGSAAIDNASANS